MMTEDKSGDLWVFGYGSLMWRPGFSFLESRQARVTGLHRSLCVFSWVHRGTREQPGLVLGLDRGGACLGLAFRVCGSRREQVIDYLREREQVTSVYREQWRAIRFADGSRATALAYVVDRGHEQYAGKLDPEQQIALIRQATGQSGANPDYVTSTAQRLSELGIADTGLTYISSRLLEVTG
jgi:cation transport protein ChaC